MTSKVHPTLGRDSFSCPHCGALAHQTWFRIFVLRYKDERPFVAKFTEIDPAVISKVEDADDRKILEDFAARLKKNPVTYWSAQNGVSCYWEMRNLSLSRCFSCDGFAVWIEDKLLYPSQDTSIVPHDDMPAEIKEDFLEAAKIVDLSPRGAAALLRLCIQKLMVAMGEKGKNINDDIAELARKGLEVQIQQALDVLRVVGNEAVHPGQIDLKDDRATALSLFDLVNLVVERRIATPNRIAEMYKGLPPSALAAIENRDKSDKK